MNRKSYKSNKLRDEVDWGMGLAPARFARFHFSQLSPCPLNTGILVEKRRPFSPDMDEAGSSTGLYVRVSILHVKPRLT